MIDMPDKLSNAAAEREAAKKALKEGSLQERETYTAKQVATRCGTDAKTMRKFFRSSHSTVEPVGQGGRYEFDARDLPKIKQEYEAWARKGKAKSNGTAPEKLDRGHVKAVAKKAAEETEDFTADEIEAAILAQEEQEHREPTEEELAALESIADLDLDDLDAEDVE